jgi:putative transposase
MNQPAVSCKRHRFPAQIITGAVWLYFPSSLRLVEDMLLEYETVRRWGIKFGPSYARRLRRKQATSTRR